MPDRLTDEQVAYMTDNTSNEPRWIEDDHADSYPDDDIVVDE